MRKLWITKINCNFINKFLILLPSQSNSTVSNELIHLSNDAGETVVRSVADCLNMIPNLFLISKNY